MGFRVNEQEGLPLQNNVIEPLRKEMPYIGTRTVANTLRKLGLSVVRHWGTNKLFTNENKLKKIAKEIGYKDEGLFEE